jgi:hypothetical protein
MSGVESLYNMSFFPIERQFFTGSNFLSQLLFLLGHKVLPEYLPMQNFSNQSSKILF